MRRRLALLAVAFVITPIICLHVGAAKVSVWDITHVMAYHLPGVDLPEPPRIAEAIIWRNRAPRVVAGIGVGAILGVSGLVLQALTRNPLAEPYILGVSSGASAGTAIAIVILGVGSGVSRSLMAFAGAALATFLVLLVGGRRHQSVLQLVLAGLAGGFIFQAVTNLVIFSSDDPETARSVMFWLLGSLAHCSWDAAWLVIACAVIATTLFWLLAPALDAVASGDHTALTVGLNPAVLRLGFTLIVSGVVAVCVAATGGIGFVGLVVPHLCRRPFGHRHRGLVIAVAVAGALFLVLADTFARALFAPAEIPIGVMTGIVGAPILLAMIGRMGGRG